MLAKTKLNSVEILIYKALIDENISYDEFVSIKNAQREYDDMKKKYKILIINMIYVMKEMLI